MLPLLALVACGSPPSSPGSSDAAVDAPIEGGVTSAAFPGYTLFQPIASTTTSLIDMDGTLVHSWPGQYPPGQSVRFTDEGLLLRTAAIPAPSLFAGAGGRGGRIELVSWDGTVVWSYEHAGDDHLQHHDAIVLPNGNVMFVAWEAKSADEVRALGRTNVTADTFWGEAIVEICRSSPTNPCVDGTIVWSFHAFEHLVQDADPSAPDYVDDVAAHADRIDLNHAGNGASPDWLHINSVAYDEATDRVMVSVHNFDEVWILDHGNPSSDLLFRYGHPAAHGASGTQTLFGQHDATFLPRGPGETERILLFNNGVGRPSGDRSTVDELCFGGPECGAGLLAFRYDPGPDFFARNVSGAQRLPNGNTLICEGPAGHLLEIASDGRIVWEYTHPANAGATSAPIFRAYRYAADHPALHF